MGIRAGRIGAPARVNAGRPKMTGGLPRLIMSAEAWSSWPQSETIGVARRCRRTALFARRSSCHPSGGNPVRGGADHRRKTDGACRPSHHTGRGYLRRPRCGRDHPVCVGSCEDCRTQVRGGGLRLVAAQEDEIDRRRALSNVEPTWRVGNAANYTIPVALPALTLHHDELRMAVAFERLGVAAPDQVLSPIVMQQPSPSISKTCLAPVR
jgi:hypothetical protein